MEEVRNTSVADTENGNIKIKVDGVIIIINRKTAEDLAILLGMKLGLSMKKMHTLPMKKLDANKESTRLKPLGDFANG